MQSQYFPNKDANSVVDTNVDLILCSSATMSNPQGDPLGANTPRVTPDGYGFITPAGIKAKLRKRYLDVVPEAHIWIQKDAVLSKGVEMALAAAGIDVSGLASDENDDENVETPAADENEPEAVATKPKTKDKKDKAKKAPKKLTVSRDLKETAIRAVAKYFIDFALFGGVLTKPFNVGVRGPVQIGMTFSVNPVNTLPIKITRQAVANEQEAESKVSTMGDLYVVRFGLYRTDITVSPFEAKRLGLTWGQLDQLITEIRFLWSHTRAGGRGGMAFERLDIFTHGRAGGTVPSEAVFRALTVTQDSAEEPTSIQDYHFVVTPIPGVVHQVVTLLTEHLVAAAE